MTDSTRGRVGGERPDVVDRLAPAVYDELRRRARVYMRKESGYQTLDPTALVHEAYLRLARRSEIDWHGETHFLAIAATEMRRVLVERARAANAKKRGGRPTRITLADDAIAERDRPTEILALDDALGRLCAESPRQARVAEMRLFAEMRSHEIAAALGVSERTVKNDWRMARAWLARVLRCGKMP